MSTTTDGRLCNGHFITRIYKKLRLFRHETNQLLSPEAPTKKITYADLTAARLFEHQTRILIQPDEPEDLAPATDDEADFEPGQDEEDEDTEVDSDDADAEQVQEDVQMERPRTPVHRPFHFSDWGDQLTSIQASQGRIEDHMRDFVQQQYQYGTRLDEFGQRLDQFGHRLDEFGNRLDQFGGRLDTFDDHQTQMAAHQLYMGDSQRRMASQLERIEYDQAFFRPFRTHWAEEQAEVRHQPRPVYQGPPVFTPMQVYGGFAYPPSQQDLGTGVSASGSRPVFPIFGTYGQQRDGDGEPSVFGRSDDMES